MASLSSLLASARVISSDPHVHTFVAQFAQEVLDARLVPIDSADCDELTLAMAILDYTSTKVLVGPEHDEYRARLVSAFALLKRIIIDSLIQSPVAKAALAAAAGTEAAGGI